MPQFAYKDNKNINLHCTLSIKYNYFFVFIAELIVVFLYMNFIFFRVGRQRLTPDIVKVHERR